MTAPKDALVALAEKLERGGWDLRSPQELADMIAAELRTLAASAREQAVDDLCQRLQQKCSDWNTYWRAPDAHGVILSQDQAQELLRDALGVEVDITHRPADAADSKGVGDARADRIDIALKDARIESLERQLRSCEAALEAEHAKFYNTPQHGGGAADTLSWLPRTCDGKEQEAFESWAERSAYDMSTHPIHWLFLNERTNAARQGWKAALVYVNEQATLTADQETK